MLMICGCVLALPLAGTPVPRFDSLVLIVDTALTTLSLVIAVQLFSQFYVTRAPAMLALGCGFLLLSLTTGPQLLRESHGAFVDVRLQFIADLALPLAAICYSLLHRESGAEAPGRGGAAVARAVVAVAALAILATWMTSFDAFANEGRSIAAQSSAWRVLTTTLLCAGCGFAIAMLWKRRASSLDLWLLVTLTAWLMDILLRVVAVDEASFTWHVARLYGLLGASCMTMALLTENATLYSRLTAMRAARRATRGKAAHDATALDPVIDSMGQPLCAISANAEAAARLLERDPPDLAEVRAALADIVNDVQRADQVLRNARELSLAPAEPPGDIDVAQLVDECLHELRDTLSVQQVTCEVRTSAQLPGVRGFRRQLQQMLRNLVTNALEAMQLEPGGRRRLRVLATRHDERTVAICIEDSGMGIRPEDLGRIFEPFFSTKPFRPGMGLAVCRKIVDAHGGAISVAPGADGGAAFKVILPASS